VVSLNLSMTLTGELAGGADNVLYATSEYLAADGTSRALGDVFFAFDPSDEENLAAPIVLDYDGDGSGLVSLDDSDAKFDMDGDGDRDETGWIEAGDALLVLDRNGDGAITDIAEISYLGDKPGARTDLEGLAAFDSNGDQVLDSRDLRFSEFELWFDNDGDGVSRASELRTLAEAGITAIGLNGQSLATPDDESGNRVYATAMFTRNSGATGTVLDAAFAYRPGAGTEIAWSGWDGSAVPSTGRPTFQQLMPGRRAKRYALQAEAGSLALIVRNAEGAVDPRAGTLGPAAMITFADRTIGLLSPLVLDLDGNGVELKGRRKAKARFDMDGDGTADDTGWIGRRDGFLVVDADDDGRVSSPAELSLLALKLDAKSSLEALATLDSNRDGRVDAADERFGELKIWRDRNGNGVSEVGEVQSLAGHGVTSISLAAKGTSGSAKLGENIILSTSTFSRSDGSTSTLADAALAFRPTPARAAPAADARLALMIQEMASFGGRVGEADWIERANGLGQPLDYLAA
jgi:hypothetical protein